MLPIDPAPTSGWSLRVATASDVEEIAELRALVLRGDLERLGRYDEVRVRQRFRDGFRVEHTWAIEMSGVLVGSVALRPEDEWSWLEHFYVAPERQRSGLGSAVLTALLHRCDQDDAVVRLMVLQGSPARRFYERHGFEVEAEDPIDVFMVRPVRRPVVT